MTAWVSRLRLWWEAYALQSWLLVLVLLVHIGADHISEFLYPGSSLARRNVTSVLRAFEAMMLFLALWAMTPWKPLGKRYATSLICFWGAFESFQIGACRMFFPLDQPSPTVPDGQGLCDLVTGWPIYRMTLFTVLAIALIRRPTSEA